MSYMFTSPTDWCPIFKETLEEAEKVAIAKLKATNGEETYVIIYKAEMVKRVELTEGVEEH